MKSDLDKLINGQTIYRNEDKKAVADRYEKIADLFRFGTLGILFAVVIMFNILTGEQARGVVLWFAALLFITATIGSIIGKKAHKLNEIYLAAESKRISKLALDVKKRVNKK